MRALIGLVVSILLVSTSALGQTALPTDRFQFTIGEGLTAAQRFAYTMEMDGALRAGPVDVTCTAAGTEATCLTPIPALTPGRHTVRIRVTDPASAGTDGLPLMSDWSLPFTFDLVVRPSPPRDVKITREPQ